MLKAERVYTECNIRGVVSLPDANSPNGFIQTQLKKNKRFRRFVRLQEGRPEFRGLQIQDLLPLPVQRLQQ